VQAHQNTSSSSFVVVVVVVEAVVVVVVGVAARRTRETARGVNVSGFRAPLHRRSTR
jgi:hypothetical protein